MALPNTPEVVPSQALSICSPSAVAQAFNCWSVVSFVQLSPPNLPCFRCEEPPQGCTSHQDPQCLPGDKGKGEEEGKVRLVAVAPEELRQPSLTPLRIPGEG